MRRILFILIFVFAVNSLYSQEKITGKQDKSYKVSVGNDSDGGLSKSMIQALRMDKPYTWNLLSTLEKEHKAGQAKGLKYNKLYFLGEINDTIAIFSHTRGIYMGGYKQQKNKPVFFRNGFGIDRIIDDTSIEDVVRYEYYIGLYRNNKRHGEGFVVKPNGKMVKGVWKRGRLLVREKCDPSAEERERIEDMMRELKNLL